MYPFDGKCSRTSNEFTSESSVPPWDEVQHKSAKLLLSASPRDSEEHTAMEYFHADLIHGLLRHCQW